MIDRTTTIILLWEKYLMQSEFLLIAIFSFSQINHSSNVITDMKVIMPAKTLAIHHSLLSENMKYFLNCAIFAYLKYFKNKLLWYVHFFDSFIISSTQIPNITWRWILYIRVETRIVVVSSWTHLHPHPQDTHSASMILST